MSHGLLEQLAAHALAVRFGPGPEGLARGQGLAVVYVAWLPWDAFLCGDRLYVRDPDAILWGVARVLLADVTHGETDVEALAERLKEKSTQGR